MATTPDVATADYWIDGKPFQGWPIIEKPLLQEEIAEIVVEDSKYLEF